MLLEHSAANQPTTTWCSVRNTNEACSLSLPTVKRVTSQNAFNANSSWDLCFFMIRAAAFPAACRCCCCRLLAYLLNVLATTEEWSCSGSWTCCRAEIEVAVCVSVCCLTSQQHASVSHGRICSDNCTCCHTETEVADQLFHLTQSQYTDTGSTSPSADPVTPGAWQDSHWSASFKVTGITRNRGIPPQAEPRVCRSLGRRLNHYTNEAVYKLQIKLDILASHSRLTPGQPDLV